MMTRLKSRESASPPNSRCLWEMAFRSRLKKCRRFLQSANLTIFRLGKTTFLVTNAALTSAVEVPLNFVAARAAKKIFSFAQGKTSNANMELRSCVTGCMPLVLGAACLMKSRFLMVRTARPELSARELRGGGVDAIPASLAVRGRWPFLFVRSDPEGDHPRSI
jgi:hypothetical protein